MRKVNAAARPPPPPRLAACRQALSRRSCAGLASGGLPLVSAHRLRHTAATEMLRAGGSLTEVGQVLRHRGRDVTSIHAKVDRLALAAVVQLWPGAAASARSPRTSRTICRSAEAGIDEFPSRLASKHGGSGIFRRCPSPG